MVSRPSALSGGVATRAISTQGVRPRRILWDHRQSADGVNLSVGGRAGVAQVAEPPLAMPRDDLGTVRAGLAALPVPAVGIVQSPLVT